MRRTTYKMLHSAKGRAKRQGLPFSLVEADIVIPETCPVLGIPLQKGPYGHIHDNSPTVDRIFPSLGYVRGNIQVISLRANRLKGNATVAELYKVYQYCKKQQE